MHAVGAILREVAAQGEKITADQLLDAQMKRGALGVHMNLFHREYDLLLTPTLSIAAFDAGKFADVAAEIGLADTRKTVGTVWFDFDQDGDLDLAVARQQ